MFLPGLFFTFGLCTSTGQTNIQVRRDRNGEFEPQLSTYFDYLSEIRRIIYITNSVESYHR